MLLSGVTLETGLYSIDSYNPGLSKFALKRAKRIYTEAGGIGLFVDAIDGQEVSFYVRFGFQVDPENPLLLYLSAKLGNY